MYQPVGYYDSERRNQGSCACCLLLTFGLISIVALSVVCFSSYDFLQNPVTSIFDEIQASIAFDQFMKDYDKTYANDNEMEIRKQIFTQNYKMIMEYNRHSDELKLGINQIADLTDEEYEEEYLSRAEDLNEKCTVAQDYIRDHPSEAEIPNADIEIDWVQRGKVNSVKNQGHCGSCWTFATIATVESIYMIRGHPKTRFSEQQIVDCCRSKIAPECKISKGCNGGLVGEGFQYLVNKGVMLESDYPYKAKDLQCRYSPTKVVFKIDGYVDIPTGKVSEMEKIIMSRPFAVGVAASNKAFRYYKSGVVDKDCPETPLNHGITVVGAGTLNGKKFWLVRNSWGAQWGDKGYIRIGRAVSRTMPTGYCGIAACPEYVKYKEPSE